MDVELGQGQDDESALSTTTINQMVSSSTSSGTFENLESEKQGINISSAATEELLKRLSESGGSVGEHKWKNESEQLNGERRGAEEEGTCYYYLLLTECYYST